MDKVNQLEQYAQARFEHAVAKRNLKERIEAELHITHNGGMFRAEQNLIAFLNSWEDNSLYMIDMYDNPIQVDRKTLLTEAKRANQYAINSYYTQYEQLKTTRRGSQV